MFTDWRKTTSFFIAAQMISLFGSSLVQYAIVWHITLTTKSGIYAMLSILCGFVPTFLLSPLAGVWADRYNRKHLIMLADGGIALATLILAVIFMTGYQPIWLLLAALAVRAFGAAVQNPSIGAMLPSIVPQNKLTQVNGLNSSLQSIIFLLSPMAAGVLYGTVRMHWIFMIDVLTAALAITVMLTLVKVPAPAKKEGGSGDYLAEFKSGLRYVRDNRYLLNLFIFMAFVMFMFSPMSMLTPLQVARNYSEGVWRLTAIEIGFSSGTMIGGLIIAAWGGFKNRVHSIAFSTVIMAICGMIFGLPIPFAAYVINMFLCGLFLPMFNTPAIVLLQEKVDPNYLGRVFGVNTMIGSSAMPLGMLLFGPLADLLNVEWIMLFTGAMITIAGILLSKNKALLAIGQKNSTEPT